MSCYCPFRPSTSLAALAITATVLLTPVCVLPAQAQQQPAQQAATHHRPHSFGGVLGQHVRRRYADALNEQQRQHNSGERIAEDPGR